MILSIMLFIHHKIYTLLLLIIIVEYNDTIFYASVICEDDYELIKRIGFNFVDLVEMINDYGIFYYQI